MTNCSTTILSQLKTSSVAAKLDDPTLPEKPFKLLSKIRHQNNLLHCFLTLYYYQSLVAAESMDWRN